MFEVPPHKGFKLVAKGRYGMVGILCMHTPDRICVICGIVTHVMCVQSQHLFIFHTRRSNHVCVMHYYGLSKSIRVRQYGHLRAAFYHISTMSEPSLSSERRHPGNVIPHGRQSVQCFVLRAVHPRISEALLSLNQIQKFRRVSLTL